MFISPKAKLKEDFVEFPIAESDASHTPKLLENWWIWIGITVALILMAYALPIYDMIQNAPPGSRGMITW